MLDTIDRIRISPAGATGGGHAALVVAGRAGEYTARLEGDLRTARLEVADGAVFTGHVAVGPQTSKAGSNGATSQAASSNASANRPEKGKSAGTPVAAGKS